MELDTIPDETLAQIQEIGTPDLVVGVLRSDPEGEAGTAIRLVREAVGGLPEARAVILHNHGSANGMQTSAAAGEDRVRCLSFTLANADPSASSLQNIADVYRLVFTTSTKLGARVCGVIASDLRAVTPRWIYGLVEPALAKGFDLVTPCYAGHKFEGLLNKSMVAPLTRALYGVRMQNPLGPDLGLSGKLMRQILARDSQSTNGQPLRLITSLAPSAIAAGLTICETNVGVRLQPPVDAMNLSSFLAQIMGPLFLDMERNAAAWQRIRGSQPILRFGEPAPPPSETGSTDVSRMRDSFQLGVQNLQDVWGLVLPPKTMFEIGRLARLPADRFRMPDELWVSIVYDFALGHRLRTISRDHLLRSLTPLYLGWVASYALEMETASPEAAEARLERLCRAYEAGKTYLVSRWRWPDRFNP